MRKFIITVFISLCFAAVQAQTVSGISSTLLPKTDIETNVRIGIRTGLNFAKLSGGTAGFCSRTAFHVGMTISVPIVSFRNTTIKQGIDMTTGLFIYSKGAKITYKNSHYDVEETVSPLYLQLPMLISYRCKPGKKVQLQIDFGPYFAYGIGGKHKAEYIDGTENVCSEKEFFGSDNTFKRADYGLHLGAGMTFANHYHFGIDYELGLCDIRHKGFKARTESWRNCIWSVNLGYIF